MRKFRFKLESVEKMRKGKEQDALRALAESQRSLQTEKELKISLEVQLLESLVRREKFGVLEANSNIVQIEENFITGTKQKIIQAEQSIVRATRHVEKAMAYYLACRQQRMMMEKLREKALERFKDEVRKRELREMDDLNIMRAAINKGVA